MGHPDLNKFISLIKSYLTISRLLSDSENLSEKRIFSLCQKYLEKYQRLSPLGVVTNSQAGWGDPTLLLAPTGALVLMMC